MFMAFYIADAKNRPIRSGPDGLHLSAVKKNGSLAVIEIPVYYFSFLSFSQNP